MFSSGCVPDQNDGCNSGSVQKSYISRFVIKRILFKFRNPACAPSFLITRVSLTIIPSIPRHIQIKMAGITPGRFINAVFQVSKLNEGCKSVQIQKSCRSIPSSLMTQSILYDNCESVYTSPQTILVQAYILYFKFCDLMGF